MTTPSPSDQHRSSAERGASLIIALVFISVFGILVSALLGFGDTQSRTISSYQGQRALNYATNAALETAITKTQRDSNIGLDPTNDPTNVCNASLGQTLLKLPAANGNPAMVVSCETQSGSGSGAPNDFGSPLPDSILTLGDRRTNGTTSSLGVRIKEPPPYNGNVSSFSWFGGSDPCGAPEPEAGMTFNKKVYPWTGLFGIFGGCAPTQYQQPFNVTGNIFSNSEMVFDEAGAVPQEVGVNGAAPGFIEARGGCTGSGSSNVSCTDPGWSFGDGKGQDPGLQPGADAVTQYGPRSISGLPVVPDDTTTPTHSAWVAAQKANCSATGPTKGLVTFDPGIYTSAKDLNDVFDSPACQNASFWFRPGVTGTFYFDFRDAAGSTSAESCSVNDGNWAFSSTLKSDNLHQWCIGGANAGGYQQIIGGTPYQWSPDPSSSTTSVLTLQPAKKSGDGPGTFFGLIPQRTQFDLGIDGKAANKIDGVTANYAMSSNRGGSSIWMSGYPAVPRGNYTNVDLDIAQAIVNPAAMNTPTIQVDYQTTGFLGLKTTGTCGPYTLTEPAPGDTAIKRFKLSDVNPVAAGKLSACLNTGDKINSAIVQYNVNRPGYQGQAPYATARLDGVNILVTTTTRPNFPRVPTATDPGGNCDPDGPGVQFIFGGDSRVYVPNGGFELCAGPNPANKATGKEIGIYGTPALPRLVPTSVDSSTGVTHRNNAKSIAEGDGPLVAAMPYGSSANLNFAGYPVPDGMSFSATDKVTLRASYDPKAGTPAIAIAGCDPLPQPAAAGATPGLRTVSLDVTSCVGTGSRFANGFALTWSAGAGPACTPSDGTAASGDCPQLDGVEMIVTLTPDNANQTLRPASGCMTVSPNYWWGVGEPDCALVRVDGPVDQGGSFIGGLIPGSQRQRRGRISVKGAIYAPSAALDIDDEDLAYPIASRGMVARHLRMRGFKYADPSWQDPVFSDYVDSRPSARQVAFVVCAGTSGPCPSTIPNPDYDGSQPESPTNRKTLANPNVIGRAGVDFEAGSNKPAVALWSIGRL